MAGCPWLRSRRSNDISCCRRCRWISSRYIMLADRLGGFVRLHPLRSGLNLFCRAEDIGGCLRLWLCGSYRFWCSRCRRAGRKNVRRRTPVIEAGAPKQVHRLEMAKFDKLIQLGFGQRTVLLALPGQVPFDFARTLRHSLNSRRLGRLCELCRHRETASTKPASMSRRLEQAFQVGSQKRLLQPILTPISVGCGNLE